MSTSSKKLIVIPYVVVEYFYTYSDLFLTEIEPYVRLYAKKYNVPGLDKEDLEQELRLRVWSKLEQYDPRLSSPKTWANTVMRNWTFNLYQKSQALKRKALNEYSPISDAVYLNEHGVPVYQKGERG